MKWFVRFLLLITFTLLCGYGMHAYSPVKSGNNPDEKTVQTTNDHYLSHHIWQIGCSSPALAKTEYRRIRGTNEEDDDDENTFAVKKVKPLKLNTSKSEFTNIALSASQPLVKSDCCLSKNRPSFSFPFISSNNRKLYSLFQSFRI